MPQCKTCGYHNKEGNNYCVNCGGVIELTEAEAKRLDEEKTKTVHSWIAYFCIFMGFSMMFGGFITWATSAGTIIGSIALSVALPDVIIGFGLMLVGVIFLPRRKGKPPSA